MFPPGLRGFTQITQNILFSLKEPRIDIIIQIFFLSCYL